MTEEEVEAVQEVAKETISRLQSSSPDVDSLSLKYPGIISGLTEWGIRASKLSSQVDISGLGSGLFKFSDKQQQLIDGVNIGANSLFVGSGLTTGLQSVANTGKLLIRDTEPYQYTLDSIRLTAEPLRILPDYSSRFTIDPEGYIRVSELGLSSITKVKSKETEIKAAVDGKLEKQSEE